MRAETAPEDDRIRPGPPDGPRLHRRRGDRAGPVRLAPGRTIGIARAVRMGADALVAAFVRKQQP